MAEVYPRKATPEESRDALVMQLRGPRRRERQEASHELARLCKEDPELILPVADELVDALGRPEAQTRWECLDALAILAACHPSDVAMARDGAEEALFDEESAPVRLAAFRFLASYGATSQARSDEVWPLLDEAVQCYHGDSAYHDMLVALLEFARGKISDRSREALVSRMSFDAENGHGYIRGFSREIVDAATSAEGLSDQG